MISGFVSYGLLEVIGLLFALLSGRLHALPSEFTWIKFIKMSMFLTIGVGLIGILLGYLFSKFQNRIPLHNIYVKSICYHIAILLLLASFKGIPYFLSFDFVFSLVLTVSLGWFFIWFYKKIDKETDNPKTNITSASANNKLEIITQGNFDMLLVPAIP